jgi:hypothetical protein
MSVPPPPPSGPPSGGFFGGPVQPPVPQYGYVGTPPVAQRPAAGPRTPELVTVSCTLLGVFAAVGVFTAAMIVLLRQGNAMARVITSVICGLWTLYWFKRLWDLGNVSAGESFGSIVHLGELFLLGLAVASALPAVLLWRPSTSSHFS